MIVKRALIELCEECIDLLHDLKKQSIISEEELQFHLRQKTEFLKEDEEKLRA